MSPHILSDRLLRPRPALDAHALLGFTVFALVVVVVPGTQLTWDLPDPLLWGVLFLVLLLLHAERPTMRRGAWFQLCLAAGALFLLQATPLEAVRAYVMWGCALLLFLLLVLAAHRNRTTTGLVLGAATTGALVLTVPALFGAGPAATVSMLGVESLFVLATAAYAVLLAFRHRRGRQRGVAVPVAALVTALALPTLPVLTHPVVLSSHGVALLTVAGAVPWLCLILMGTAALARARHLYLREETVSDPADVVGP